MRRFPSAFYRDLRAARDRLGSREYNRDTDLRPSVIALIKDYEHSSDDLYIDAADNILDNIEKTEHEDAGGETLFPLSEHLPLGGKQRIARGAMGIAEIRRRERIIDENKERQDAAWAREKRVNRLAIDRLADLPLGTRWSDVIGPDGAPL